MEINTYSITNFTIKRVSENGLEWNVLDLSEQVGMISHSSRYRSTHLDNTTMATFYLVHFEPTWIGQYLFFINYCFNEFT